MLMAISVVPVLCYCLNSASSENIYYACYCCMCKLIFVHLYYCLYTERLCSIPGQIYKKCGTACPPTCRRPNPRICILRCEIGCQCVRGLVLDEVNKKCVHESQCPPRKCEYMHVPVVLLCCVCMDAVVKLTCCATVCSRFGLPIVHHACTLILFDNTWPPSL